MTDPKHFDSRMTVVGDVIHFELRIPARMSALQALTRLRPLLFDLIGQLETITAQLTPKGPRRNARPIGVRGAPSVTRKRGPRGEVN